MKEYGGYMELEVGHNLEYHKTPLKLNTATNCLAFLIREKGIKKIYLPYFMCPTARWICKRYNIGIKYFNIDNHFKPIIEKKPSKDEYVYIVNYYGQLNNEDICYFKEIYGNIIIDNVQAFFQNPVPGIDTLYSCRKFFGVSDGAYLLSDLNIIPDDIEQDYSSSRIIHLIGRLEKTASEFYSNYKTNEKKLIAMPIKKMSKLTESLLKSIDYEKVMSIRERNFSHIEAMLGDKNDLQLQQPIGAYAYPFYVQNGKEIREKLCAEHIYIPLLWPDVLEKCESNTLEFKFAQNILPLPVDQRYDDDDMEYICGRVMELLKSY